MAEPSSGPGGLPTREPRELQDGGPALRVSERDHPAGPAFSAQLGWPVPDILGPADEGPSRHEIERQARELRREPLYGGVAVAVLLLVAAVSFWASGSARADTLLQALAIVFVAFAAGSVAFGIRLSRAD
jgi:hypothetical protein